MDGKGEQAMTREEALALYEPMHASILTIIDRARGSCGPGDLKRAADRMGVLGGGKILLTPDHWGFQMVCDLALFEPNDRGVRPFDRFLAGPGRTLPEREKDIAARMANGFFSVLQSTGKRENGGIGAKNLLRDDQPLWLMEKRFDTLDSLPELFGMRVFDMGPFHAVLGPLAALKERLAHTCAVFQKAEGHHPFRRSLAATIYGLNTLTEQSTHPSGMKFTEDLIKGMRENGIDLETGEFKPAREA